MKPRIFVGTLYCQEAEFKDCCNAINNQIGVDVTHKVIANMPEFEAHNELWRVWEKVKNNYDLFFKIDADTILIGDDALLKASYLFNDKTITSAQILLHDYFTDDLISGLNIFTKSVSFRPSLNKLFADHADINNKKILKGEPVKFLAPIGFHCLNPNDIQSFHYGYHRALKKQKEIIKKCANVWLKKRDSSRAWALAGAISKDWSLFPKYDYKDKYFERKFKKYEPISDRLNEIEAFALKITR